MPPLDLDFVRSRFPAFSQPSLEGQAFFENAGGSYICAPLIARLMRFYTERKVQPYAPYAASMAAGAEMDEARERLAPHGLPDVGALKADIYLFSTYKTYGPHQGAMVIRRDLAARLPNQGHHFNAGTLTKRFTPAGPDHAQIAACAGIADYIDELAGHHGGGALAATARGAMVHDLMRAHEISLLQPVLDWASQRNDLRLLGPRTAASRAPTVALLADRPGEDLARDLAVHGIMAGGGGFYANRALAAQGIEPDHGVLRLSFVHYTSAQEIDRLLAALDRVL